MSLFATLIAQAVKKVQEKNQKDPNVKTAEVSVFDRLKNKIDQAKTKANSNRNEDRGGLFDQLRNRIEESRKENEANPNEETADSSVFDDMQKEIETLKAKIAEQERIEAEQRIADLKAQIAEEKAEEERKKAEAELARAQEEARRRAEEEARIKAEEERKKGLFNNIQIPSVPDLPSVPRPGNLKEIKGKSAVTNSMGGSIAIRMHPELNAPQSVKRVPDKSLIRIMQFSTHTLSVDGMDSRWVEIEYEGEQGWVLERYLNFN